MLKNISYGNCFSCNILFIAADNISLDFKCLQSIITESDTALSALVWRKVEGNYIKGWNSSDKASITYHC